MKNILLFILTYFTIVSVSNSQNSPQNPQRPQMGKRPNQTGLVNLDSLRWRDMCIVAVPVYLSLRIRVKH